MYCANELLRNTRFHRRNRAKAGSVDSIPSRVDIAIGPPLIRWQHQPRTTNTSATYRLQNSLAVCGHSEQKHTSEKHNTTHTRVPEELVCRAMTDSGLSPSMEQAPTRRGRLQRSERLLSDHSNTSSAGGGVSGSYSSWEALVRDSFGHVAWPMKITSWELVSDREAAVQRVR